MNPSAAFKTCNADSLQYETQNGWTLREVVLEDQQEIGMTYYTQEVLPGQSYTQSVQKQGPPIVARRAVFVLERSRDEELASLREELRIARAEEKLAKELRAKAEKSEKESEEARKGALGRAERAELSLAREQAAHQTTRHAKQKLETDIGKLRTEIGAARFREILPAPPIGAGKESP